MEAMVCAGNGAQLRSWVLELNSWLPPFALSRSNIIGQRCCPYCNEVPPTGFGVAIGGQPNANQRRGGVARVVADHTLFTSVFGV